MDHVTESATTEVNAAAFITKIKKTTADLHLQLESQALLSAIMKPSVTRHQYCYYLTLMKKIEEVYETDIIPTCAVALPAFEHRKASQLISEDIYNIACTLPSNFVIKDYTVPGEKNSVPFALGFMYVMQGSKLGGKVIYKHIHRTLGYSHDSGARFIADYGINTFVLWKEFLSAFSAYVAQNDCEEEAIQGAEYAFGSIHDFFELNRSAYES